jgi:hypothetical protein
MIYNIEINPKERSLRNTSLNLVIVTHLSADCEFPASDPPVTVNPLDVCAIFREIDREKGMFFAR